MELAWYILVFLCTGIAELQIIFEKGNCSDRNFGAIEQQLLDTQRLLQGVLEKGKQERRRQETPTQAQGRKLY